MHNVASSGIGRKYIIIAVARFKLTIGTPENDIREGYLSVRLEQLLNKFQKVSAVPSQKLAPSGEQGAPGCKD